MLCLNFLKNLTHQQSNRYGKASCAQIIGDKAPDIVNSKDHEGNTPHMLTYRFDAGVPCQLLLGMNVWYCSNYLNYLVSFVISDKIGDKTMQNNKGETWGHLSIMSNGTINNLSKTIIISILAIA